MKLKANLFLLLAACFFVVSSCKTDSKKTAETAPTTPKQIRKVPKFSADNAFQMIEEQLAFGVRYPGSPGHGQLIDYIVEKAESYADNVIQQDFKASFLDEKNVKATNIIAEFNPENPKRIILAAHFDSRKIAEKDNDEGMRDKPIMGADDGASGVAVLLEIGRLIKENGIDMGVDLIFFDAEDNGDTGSNKNWCLGSKYWGKNTHKPNYSAQYGILLDMVGAENAQFGLEGYSKQIAPKLQAKIWRLAKGMGYGNFFMDFDAGFIEDDHIHMYQGTRIPVVDIINRPVKETDHGFGEYHHTHDDDIDIISKETLKAVGKVVTAVIYNESNGRF